MLTLLITSKSDDYKDDNNDGDEMIRAISPSSSKARLIGWKYESQSQILSLASQPKSQRARGGSSWQGLSRRSILYSVQRLHYPIRCDSGYIHYYLVAEQHRFVVLCGHLGIFGNLFELVSISR
jgi:hypothetical protein